MSWWNFWRKQATDPRAVNAQRYSAAGLMSQAVMPQPDAGSLAEVEVHHPIVWRCIQVKAEDASSVPLKLYSGSHRDPGDEISSHPVLDLFERPAPNVTPAIFWQSLYADVDSEGNWYSFVYKDRASRPVSFERLIPGEVTAIPDEKMGVSGYQWKPTGDRIYPTDVVENVKTRNPQGSYRGLGTLTRLRMLLHLDRVMQDWNWSRYRNGIPTQYLIFFNGTFREGEREQVEALLRSKWAGPGADPFVLIERNADGEKAFEVKDFPRPTEDELAFLNSEERLAYRIALAFGVPPAKLQDYSQSTRVANADAQERMYWEDTIRSMHVLVEDWLNFSFLPKYYAGARMFFRFDYSGVRALQQSAKERADIHAIYIDRGVMTRNEARTVVGLPPLEGEMMDEPLQLGRPLGAAPEPMLPPSPGGREAPEDPEDPEDPEEDDLEEDEEDPEDTPAKSARRNGHRKAERVGDLFDLNAEREVLAAAVQKKIATIIKEAGEQQLRHIGVAGVFDLKSPEAAAFLRTQIVDLVEEVVTNTNEMVRAAVALAIQDGKPVAAMRDDIQAAFRFRRENWQLDRIARTEVHTAQEGGGFLASKENGVEMKSWLTARDSKVRGLELEDEADHDGIEAAGPIPIGEPFIDKRSGAEMMFPGDRTGANVTGADTINCRCTMTADFSHLELSARPRRIKEIWEEKDRQRQIWEKDLARTVKSYLIGLERRALERFDETAALAAGPLAGV